MSLSEDLRANGTKTGRNYSAFGELCLLDEYIGLAATKVSAPCPSHSDGTSLRIKILPRKPMNVFGEPMAAVIQPVCDSADPALPSTPRLYSVVRQPILDLHGRVHAYELLFRGVPALTEFRPSTT